MTLEQILPSLYRVPLKAVNAFVIDLGDDSLVLIDAGTPGDTKAILDVIGELGRRSADVRHILVTHCHADHAGGLAELKKATGAPAYMHPADAEMVRVGRALRPLTPTPGPLNRAVFWLFLRNGPKTLPATGVEHEVSDGEDLPVARWHKGRPRPRPLCRPARVLLASTRWGALHGRRRGQRGGAPGPLPRPRGPGRGEAQREEARRIGLRNGLLRPRQGDPARGVSALQKGFRGRPEGNGRVAHLGSCDIPLASIGIILAPFLCVRSSPPAGLLTLSPLAREGNPRPGARKSRSPTLRFPCAPSGALLQRVQLLAHCEEVSEGEEHEARAVENGGRRRDREARHEPAPTSIARLDDIADGEPTEDALRTREDHACFVAVLLELDEPENEKLLAR